MFSLNPRYHNIFKHSIIGLRYLATKVTDNFTVSVIRITSEKQPIKYSADPELLKLLIETTKQYMAEHKQPDESLSVTGEVDSFNFPYNDV